MSSMAYPAEPLQISNKIKIPLTGTQETLMGPLIARARDARMPQPILNDIYAAQILDWIDHDTDKFHVDDTQTIIHALRAACMDRWIVEFLTNNPECTVVHLACGLDSRWQRIQPDLTRVRWIDLDLPDVIEIRTKLIPNPEGNYMLVAANVTEESWLQQIPADRPTVIVGQGLMMYLEEEAGKRMIQRVVEHFKSGQLIIDCVSTIMLSLQHSIETLTATGSNFQWGVDEPKTLEALHPQLTMLECLGPSELGFSHMPLNTRIMLSTYSYLPWFRYLSSYVRFAF
ncbi:putative polyketide synthase protein [Annulohypoxylon truncatum]|uniref:putative polyketide synthase protein n=1 Tax=Annulohypoxylon truncatum TaxID=327061 RepID=UPI002007A558|nr:putative polyketide synthase protein [Annulohypoxylon truncatum]KAI1208229.1 putative polyketide synthase protein [Annulohypoxylon truncatum]